MAIRPPKKAQAKHHQASDLHVVSWNVNGIRSCEKKGFLDYLRESAPDILGLQEVRALPEQLSEALKAPQGFHTRFSPAERKGYSGVAIYSRQAPDQVQTTLAQAFDVEGRLQIARYGKLSIANVYFPNGKGKERDNSRVPYKLDFYRALFDRLEEAKNAGEPLLVIGDFNTAHKPIDLARPKANLKVSGFLPEEREEFDRWLSAGWVDTFREVESGPEHYSWWSNRAGARERNVGWRIDYILASPGAMPFFRNAAIHSEVMGSDHCPVSVTLDRNVLGQSK